MSDDELRRQRALTAEFREALEAFGEDAERLVRDEVARSLPDQAALEQMVRSVAREEAEQAERGRRPGVSWPTAGAAALLTLVGFGLGWAGARWLGAGDSRDGPAAQATVSPPVAEAPVDPALRTGLYDSLFASRDSSLLTLTDGLEGVAGADVAGVVSAWRSGDDTSPELVHDVLVQLALRIMVDTTLVVDGVLPRSGACDAPACLALLRHWQGTAGRDGYPTLAEDGAPDSVAVSVVERLAILQAAGIP